MFTALKREYNYLRGALRTLKMTTPIAKTPTRVFPFVMEELAAKYGDKEALLSDKESYTYKQLDARANQYARWALAQGIKKGDAVCLFMLNRPEYFIFWLGLTRMGAVVALINTNLSGTPLAHCVTIVKPKHVVVASELLGAYRTAQSQITGDPKVWTYGANDAGLARLGS